MDTARASVHSPDWYLWEGGFLAIGSSDGIVPSHAHHALQIVLTTEGEVAISADGREWRSARGLVVPADVEHVYDGKGAKGAMFFIDPESIEGVWLRSTIGNAITIVPETRLAAPIAALRTYIEAPMQALDIGSLIRLCVDSLCAGALPSRRLDERVTKVLDRIRESDDLRISLEDAAAIVHLSPSRFQHLFKQQLGLAFRRYILWRKLMRAILAIATEPSLAAAAHAADFADAAHLTRTFYQMFGLPPSVMMKGNFFVIRSPFEAAAAKAA